jgi:lipoate-protein ligase A
MRFIHTPPNSGEWNMRFDESLARRLAAGDGAPTVRLFTWNPWAISLGFNQDGSSLDAKRCAEAGIDIVRRPTGGRAVFHAQELTYSVAMRADQRSVLDIYNQISRALVRGLEFFGVRAALSKSQPDLRAHYKSPSSIPCFTASARYEIEFEGKKIVGSAQRRFRSHETGDEVVLQHGSILTGPAHRDLVNYLVLANEETRNTLMRELNEKTTDLSAILGSDVDLNELATCIRRGFEQEWHMQFDVEQVLPSPQLYA